ncbi:MAG: hypothetical protein ABSC01_00960 [Verrucomicrobiota bacterium]
MTSTDMWLGGWAMTLVLFLVAQYLIRAQRRRRFRFAVKDMQRSIVSLDCDGLGGGRSRMVPSADIIDDFNQQSAEVLPDIHCWRLKLFRQACNDFRDAVRMCDDSEHCQRVKQQFDAILRSVLKCAK